MNRDHRAGVEKGDKTNVGRQGGPSDGPYEYSALVFVRLLKNITKRSNENIHRCKNTLNDLDFWDQWMWIRWIWGCKDLDPMYLDPIDLDPMDMELDPMERERERQRACDIPLGFIRQFHDTLD